jgi:hypothetical protein
MSAPLPFHLRGAASKCTEDSPLAGFFVMAIYGAGAATLTRQKSRGPRTDPADGSLIGPSCSAPWRCVWAAWIAAWTLSGDVATREVESAEKTVGATGSRMIEGLTQCSALPLTSLAWWTWEAFQPSSGERQQISEPSSQRSWRDILACMPMRVTHTSIYPTIPISIPSSLSSSLLP